MEPARRQEASRLRSGLLAAFASAVLLSGACGPAESVATDIAAAEAPPNDVAATAGAVGSPVAAPDPVNVAPDVLASELRDAAVQALDLPDPLVEVEPNEAGTVSLVVANPWETIDLTIRSIEETPTEVVVFASPVRTEWQLGDGNEIRCNEFGNLDGAGECVHTYPQHGRFEGDIELVWGLSWTLDGQHQGLFETASTASTFVVTRQ